MKIFKMKKTASIILLLLTLINLSFAGKIGLYPPKLTNIVLDDKLLGTDFSDGSTKNFTLDALKTVFTGSEVKVISDLSQLGPLVGGFYELSEGTYLFDGDFTFANNIKLTTVNGRYLFRGLQANQFITSTATGNFIDTTTVTGIWLQIENLFFSSSTADNVIRFANGDSLIMNFVLFNNTAKCFTITDTSFLTIDAFAMVGCDDGGTITNTDVITMQRPQWSSGTDSGGTAFSISGTGSRLVVSGIECEAKATETIFDIDAGYSGAVSMTSGAFTDDGGVFFDPAGKDQTYINVGVLNISGVPNSKTVGSWTVQDNLAVTALTQNQWTDFDFNALAVTTASNERFTLTNTTTAEIRYDGLQNFEGGLICSISGFGAGSAAEYQFRAVLNGVPLSPISILSANEITGTMSSTTLLVDLSLVTNDLIRIQVRNIDSDSDFTGKFVTTRINF
jgi:hypothetical protein